MLQILTLIIIITIPTIALEPNFSLPDWQGLFQKFVSVRVAFTVFLLEAFFLKKNLFRGYCNISEDYQAWIWFVSNFSPIFLLHFNEFLDDAGLFRRGVPSHVHAPIHVQKCLDV